MGDDACVDAGQVDRDGDDDRQHLVVAFLPATPSKLFVLGFELGNSPPQLSVDKATPWRLLQPLSSAIVSHPG